MRKAYLALTFLLLTSSLVLPQGVVNIQKNRRGDSGIAPFTSDGAYINRSTAQTVTATGAASLDTEIFDSDNFWAIGNPTRFTVDSTDWYLFGGTATTASGNNATQAIQVRANGAATILSGLTAQGATDNLDNIITTNIVYPLAATNYLELFLIENVIGNKDFTDINAWIGRLPSASGVFASTSGTLNLTTANDRYALPLVTETQDDDNFHDNVTDNTRLTTDTTGWHLIGSYIETSSYIGIARIFAKKNGSTDEHEQSRNIPTSAAVHRLAFVFPDYLTATNYYEFEASASVNTQTVTTGRGWMIRLPNATGARVKKTSTQTLTSGAEATITFNSGVRIDGSYWSAGNSTRFIAQQDGYHYVGGRLSYSSGSNSLRIRLRKTFTNASTAIYAPLVRLAATGDYSYSTGLVIWLDTGEYIEILGSQDSGSNVDVTSGEGWILALS